jgi:hypothetical protein
MTSYRAKLVSVSYPDGYIQFEGDEVGVVVNDDGSLLISKWQKDTERGTAIFAKGGWYYVRISQAT